MQSRKIWVAARLLAFVSLALSASVEAARADVDEFGTVDGNDLWIPAVQFVSVIDATPAAPWLCCAGPQGYYKNSADSAAIYEAPLLLPQGAYLDSWRAFYFDDSSASNFDITLFKYYDDITANPAAHILPLTDFVSSGRPGTTNHQQVEGRTIDLREPSYPNVTRNKAADFYVFRVTMPADDLVGFKGVRVFWHRQVSPAPATATFNDVPTSDPAFQYIEALAASGITAGCNTAPPQYCPDATLTRRQMAVFLAKALGLHWPPF